MKVRQRSLLCPDFGLCDPSHAIEFLGFHNCKSPGFKAVRFQLWNIAGRALLAKVPIIVDRGLGVRTSVPYLTFLLFMDESRSLASLQHRFRIEQPEDLN
jgi:hypothetical protein